MLKYQSHSLLNQLPIQKPFIGGDSASHSSSAAYSPNILRQHTSSTKKSNATSVRSTYVAGNIKAISNPFLTNETMVKCVITILPTIGSIVDGVSNAGVSLDGVTDVVSDLLGRSFLLELVSNDLDSKGNRKTVREYARYEALDSDISIYKYKCNFVVPKDFGEIGAVLVENEYSKKMFFKTIVLDIGVTFTCESWIPSKNDNPDKRIFFADKIDDISATKDMHTTLPSYWGRQPQQSSFH